MAPILFWEAPRQYLLWSARNKPALFWSVALGFVGPVMLFTVPPVRHRLGDPARPAIPLTYPIPVGPRKTPSGYDD